ncbi:cyclic nucleotide-binding domain-containing protein [Trebonia kvetii]|nr:cyclic nucleotide-binding domain-containing protein [Trebonia kvetii]
MIEVTASGLYTQRFLRGMETGQLDTLAHAATEVMYPAGHRLFSDGEYADKFWLIESGHVSLDLLVPGEGPVIVDHIGIGGIVGWSWLLSPYQWAFGAVCVTEVKAYQFDAKAVRELCAADPALRAEVTARLFEVVARRLQDTRTRLIARSYGEVRT